MTAAGPSAGRWLGVGHSEEHDPYEAGRAAARAALRGRDVKLVVVFCSHSYGPGPLLKAIGEESGAAPVIGCSAAGELITSDPDRRDGVLVTALGGDGFSVATAAADSTSGDPRQAGASAAECLAEVERGPHRVLLMLTDGLAGDQQEIVRGAYSVAGAAVPLVGGCAGDELRMEATFQFCGERILEDAVVAAAISSDAPLGIGVRHGWRRVGDPVLVTESRANRVYRLDNRPALDVYLERLGAPGEVGSDLDAFTRFALSHPLGLARRDNEDRVRLVNHADFEDRSLGSFAAVPQGAVAWFMTGDRESVLEAASSACEEAVAALGGNEPLGLLAFNCVARRDMMDGRAARQEFARIAEHARGAPVAGLYTYGEIARTRGASGFHNQALVTLAVS